MVKKKRKIAKQKTSKKEKNGLLKFIFLAIFLILLGCALWIDKSNNSQEIAAYTPKNSIQIGWFNIIRKIIKPPPGITPPLTAAPTPCVNANYNQQQLAGKQRIAMVVQPTNAPIPTEAPYIPTTPMPTYTPRPTRPPATITPIRTATPTTIPSQITISVPYSPCP